MLHHDDEVHVAVNGGADAAIVVDKLLFGYLGMKGNGTNEMFSSAAARSEIRDQRARMRGRR